MSGGVSRRRVSPLQERIAALQVPKGLRQRQLREEPETQSHKNAPGVRAGGKNRGSGGSPRSLWGVPGVMEAEGEQIWGICRVLEGLQDLERNFGLLLLHYYFFGVILESPKRRLGSQMFLGWSWGVLGSLRAVLGSPCWSRGGFWGGLRRFLGLLAPLTLRR